MGGTSSPLQLMSLELSGADIAIKYESAKGKEAVFQPDVIRLAPQGMFVNWPGAPANLTKVRVEWTDSPFSPMFSRDCTVVNRDASGLEIDLDRPAPLLQEWFAGFGASLDRREPDAALKTSKLYTSATVVSACGLLCGAMAILLPILVTDRSWVDLLSKALLVAMVVSIGGFAWIRVLAGKAELRALKNGRG